MIKTVDVLIATVTAGVLLAACGSPEDDDRPRPASTSAMPAASHDEDARGTAAAPYADRDRDGRVTRDEAGTDPKLLAEFDRYDANGDDALDRAEFARLEAKADEQRAEPGEPSRPTMRPRGEYPPN